MVLTHASWPMRTLTTKLKLSRRESHVKISASSHCLLKYLQNTNSHQTLQLISILRTLHTQNYSHWIRTVSLTSKDYKSPSNQKVSLIIMLPSDSMLIKAKIYQQNKNMITKEWRYGIKGWVCSSIIQMAQDCLLSWFKGHKKIYSL